MKVENRKNLLSGFCLASIVICYALFLKCYFPLKQGLGGYASITNLPPEPFSGRSDVPAPRYKRLVLMVIDALRTDFVLEESSSYMPFTRRLLRDGRGVAFAAKTHLPTVTLPRLKAITSGSIPGFVDVVLNFGSTALTDDNLITQLKLAGKTLTFFGDDTWLSLFPDHFTRADGTVSFFVSDFTEVDVNVTRHLKKELAADDWDAMILHYLGLDHIGHVYGPSSNLVPPKLLEMDDVVRQIYSAMSSWSEDDAGVLVICGDHGMSDQGGHGGASPGETNVPVIFLSPHSHFHLQKKDTHELQQIDLCPTLSVLLGLPIPRNNLGRVEVGALPLNMPLEDLVRLLQLNAAQVAVVLEQNVDSIEQDHACQLYQDSLTAHSLWLAARNSSSAASWESEGTRVLMGYQDAVEKMSQRISQTSTSYDMYGIVVGILCLWMNLFIQVLVINQKKTASLHFLSGGFAVTVPIIVVAMLSHVTLCTSQHSSDILCGTSLLSLLVQLVVMVVLFVSLAVLGRLLPSAVTGILTRPQKKWKAMEVVLLGSTVVHSLSLVSSSFVEEEHQTWYFFSSTVHVLILVHPVSCLLQSASLKGEPCCSSTPNPADKQLCHGDPTSVRSQGLCSTRSRASDTAKTSGKYLGDRISAYTKPQDFSESHCDNDSNRMDKDDHYGQFNEQGRELSSAVSVRGSAGKVAGLLCILCLLRVLRRWNQTGNKWLDVPDVGDWLVRPENKLILSVLVAISLLCLLLTRLGCLREIVRQLTFLGALVFVYLAKACSGFLLLPAAVRHYVSPQGVMEARCAYLCIAGLLMCCLRDHTASKVSTKYGTSPVIHPTDNANNPSSQHDASCHSDQSAEGTHLISPNADGSDGTDLANQIKEKHKALWEGLQVVWLCVMCLLLRPHNMAQVVMMSVVEKLAGEFVLPSIRLGPTFILLYCLMMGQASFFFQGNSNSLSTVDVSAGLTALHDYQPVIIGVQMCMSTYAGVFFWLITSLKYLTSAAPAPVPLSGLQQWLSDSYTDMCSTAILTRALPLAVYTVLVTLMRYHLFVWTVFSPKLLYEGMLTLVMFAFCLLCLLMARSWRSTSKYKV